jgi:hypothetical protein
MPYEVTVNWIKCAGNQWCDLTKLDLSHPHFRGLEGVYIIWHGGQNPWTVYVGQGLIAQRLAAHRADLDPRNLPYRLLGLFVTWAAVGPQYRDGAERFLAERLQPRLGVRHPDVPAVVVNLPW